eukprot:2890494-Ditylum_brightwellii.AAC.1
MKTLRQHADTLMGKCTIFNLLWWKWPLSQWPDLLYGIPGNFMIYPSNKVTPNLSMDKEQKNITAAFVDELVEIGPVQKLLEGGELYTNGLLK